MSARQEGIGYHFKSLWFDLVKDKTYNVLMSSIITSFLVVITSGCAPK